MTREERDMVVNWMIYLWATETMTYSNTWLGGPKGQYGAANDRMRWAMDRCINRTAGRWKP